jgi:hypothetical protein
MLPNMFEAPKISGSLGICILHHNFGQNIKVGKKKNSLPEKK